MTLSSTFNRNSTADQVLEEKNLSGKIAMVTGANGGIGYETARSLAAAGALVILACRNPTLGEDAISSIRRDHPDAQVELVSLDLADPASIQACLEDIAQREHIPQLDILICNAGSMSTKYLLTDQGIERTVAVCHLGHFMLTKGLLDTILKAPAPRIVMVSSESHRYPLRLNFDNLLVAKKQNRITAFNAYGQAKLCNALMALELQQRYGSQGLTACAVHPGALVTTGFGRESWLTQALFTLVSPLTKTPHQGAATSVMCATHDNAEDIAGGYFSHCRAARSSAEAGNTNVAKKLWDFSEHHLQNYANV